MTVTGVIALVVLILFCVAGLLLIPLGMPGNFVILAGALVYNLLEWSMAVGLVVLGVLLGLAVLGEVLEYVLGMKLAENRGTSRPAVWGAVAGGIVGALVGVPVPVIGSVIGLFVGVCAGALLVELVRGKDLAAAFSSALGAFYGRLGAIFAKMLLGALMIGILFAAVF